MNAFDQMRAAVSEAESTLRAVDKCSNDMAKLLVGRLRKADSWTLAHLKRELKDFNVHTRKWKNK
jgi:hypothetical protein